MQKKRIGNSAAAILIGSILLLQPITADAANTTSQINQTSNENVNETTNQTSSEKMNQIMNPTSNENRNQATNEMSNENVNRTVSNGKITEESMETNSEVAGNAESTDNTEHMFLHTETFSKDYSMSGLFSECTEYFQAENWNINAAEFVMIYNVTQLKDKDISDFTVSLNGEPFYSGRFNENTNGEESLTLPLPSDKIKDGINELKVESYIRTRDSLPCVDDVSKANWFNISEDSAIHISYTPNKSAESIADVYSKMTSIYATENKKSAVIIPNSVTDTAITAAANILTGISKNARAAYENLELVTSDEAFGEANARGLDYGIFVGEYDFLPEIIKSQVPDIIKKEMAQNGAAMFLLQVSDMQTLVLTGTEEELIAKGAAMFGNADYMNQMTEAVHLITEEENPIMEKEAPLEYATLTEEGGYVNGTFRQTFSFTQSAYANKMLSPASQIYLKMRYAKNLDFNRSLMTVYINDVPIGSHRLSEEYAEGDEAEFFVPADLKISGDFQIKVAFDLELEDLWCTLRQGETPWAYVSPESMMKIVLADSVPLLLEHYPAPFLKTKSMDNVLIALPETPSKEELSAMRKICLTLGRFEQNNSGKLTVKQNADIEDCKSRNVIVIGTFESNELIKESNKRLYFRFNDDGTELLTNEKKRITQEAGKEMGSIQLLESPFEEEDKGMLFVTGPTQKAVGEAAEYLANEDMLWKLKGDGSVITDGEIQNYQFKETQDGRLKTAEEIVKRDDVLHLLVSSLLVAGVLIIGLIFILVKHLRGRKAKKKGGKKNA